MSAEFDIISRIFEAAVIIVGAYMSLKIQIKKLQGEMTALKKDLAQYITRDLVGIGNKLQDHDEAIKDLYEKYNKIIEWLKPRNEK